MENKTKEEIILVSFLALFIIFLVVVLSFMTPEEIVNMIGVQNSYLIAFVVSFLAGFSFVTSFSMVATLVTLTVGGINPIYLGIVAGIALAMGDLIMFFVLSKGRKLVGGKWKKRLDRFAGFFKGKSRKIIPFLAYLYIGLTPFPNDLLLVFLAIINVPRKKMRIPIILGDITFPLMITILTAKGVMFFT